MEQEFDRYLITEEGVEKIGVNGEVVGVYQVGTIQKLPVEYGDKLVESGVADLVDSSDQLV